MTKTTSPRDRAAIIGVGGAACAACCAGPILGLLAAIGISTAAGYALFGIAGLIIAGTLAGIVLYRRRRSRTTCRGPAHTVTVVAAPTVRRSVRS